MTGDECIQFILNLCDSENESLRQIGDHFKCIFAVEENSPSEELLRRIEEIDNGVKNWFPSRFAEGYESWRDKAVEFQIALESGVYENIEAEFISMFSKLKDIWKMLLEFLPFLLMLTVNRMNKSLILDVAKEEFKNAFSIYKSIYHENDDRKNEEHNKVKLTIYLIQLFRKLHSRDAIRSEFILRPLLKDENGFNSLFPLRFDSIILLFSQLNDEAMEQILSEGDAKMLKNTAFLSNWAILDITNTIMPIAENFFFVYIVSIDLDYDPYRAAGISISGIGNPKRVYFRLLPGYQSDSSRLQEANLYLINRKKQTDFQEFDPASKQYLTPDDYMNLTPLMLYTTFEDSPDKRFRRKEIPEQQELFVFCGYDSRNSKKFLKFLEFSGKRTAEIIKSEESQYSELFDEYETFSRNLNDYYADIEKIIRQVVRNRGSSIYKTDGFDLIFNKTWKISLGHLSSLLRADGYDGEAKLRENLLEQDTNVKFIEELFVSPKEEELLNQFVSSDKRGFIIVGKSGMGKSNLLCSFFLKQRRKEQLNIFIDARRLNNKNIRHFLKESIVERIHESWVLKDFDNYLQSIQENITIIIDGVNEYNNTGGAIGLVEEVCDFIEDPNIFENAKIIASCRTEIWNQYKEEIGAVSNILSDEYFFTDSGDAVIISGFEDSEERESLYSAYQKYYKLKPELYRSLSQTVKELIKQPFMMGLIAETYSNRFMISPGSSRLPETNKIPKKLDYFLIFKLLTERKKNDAGRLFSVSNINRDTFDREYENCLYTFARILYDKIAGANTPGRLSDSDDKSDTIQVDHLHKSKDFKKFLEPFSSHNSTTIFSAVIQVGLIEKLYINEYDYWGNKKSGKAYKFFHDQYTQFWLSAVYSDGCILGKIETAKLRADKNMLDIITQKIENILESSKNAPVLFGGLFHWLYNNMHHEKDDIGDFFAILFNRLVESDSTIVHYFLGSFLHWLIEANIVSPSKLNNELVKNGSVRLRRCFYEHIVHIWPDISPHTLQAILAAEKDETLIREISDIFVNLFTLEPEEVIAFLDKTLASFEKLSFEILTKSVFEKRKLKEGFIFAQMFITSSLLCNFSDPGKLTIIKDFLKQKYNLIINIIIDENAAVIKGLARDKMYRILEDSGIYQWNQAIGSQGRNNTFFVEDDGLIQRDVLYDFYKYCVDFHNGDMERLSLDKNSEFMKMTLKMIEYRQSSIIGYVATQILAGVLTYHMERLDEIIDEILKLNFKGALFYGIILVCTLSILEESSIDHILEIIHKKFIPIWMEDFDKDIYNIITFFIIGAKDFDRYWEKCENILSDIIDKLREKADDNYIENFGDILSQYLFLPNIKISLKICDYLLDKDLHKDPLLGKFTLKVLASMLARSPKVLKRILDAHGIEDITGDVRPFLTEDVIKNRSQASYKHSWSNFLNLGLLGSKKLRYLLIKNFLAGLVQANMVPEFVKEFRRLVIEGIKTFLIDDSGNDSAYEHLTVEEGLSSTECQRKVGGGVKWEGKI